MSTGRALQFLDQRDLGCCTYKEGFTEPMKPMCLHSYSLCCEESSVERHVCKLKCLKCDQKHKQKKENFKNLIENENQRTCSNCDNQPKYHCSECLLYLCLQCCKHYKIIPSQKDHPLDRNGGCSKDDHNKCPIHCTNILEFYCSTCKKSACKQCEHVLCCFKNKHNITEIQTIVENFHQTATELTKKAQSNKQNLKRTLDLIPTDVSDFESNVKLCRTAIEVKEKTLIKKVEEKSQTIISQLEDIYKGIKEDINLKLTQVNNLMVTIHRIMNKPEEIDTLGSHKIKAIRDKFLEIDDNSIIPKFILSTNTNLEELINTEGIATFAYIDCTYKVAQDDEAITVTKGQPFVVKVSSLADTCQLKATLKNSSENTATEIEYHGSGEYKITGRCNVEGEWQMKITVGEMEIKGSPVNIKVESLGLVHVIGDISVYKKDQEEGRATDVVLDTNGYILVSSSSDDILKFNQSGLFVARIQVPQNVRVKRMHHMDDGHLMYSPAYDNCVVMCDNKFEEIRSLGKGILECPSGLAVNNETRVLYVADNDANCVFKFNVDDGRLLGKIGSKCSIEGQMIKPIDVTLTKEGNVIVAEFGNHRILMFDVNDNFIGVVCHEFWHPNGVTMDMYENIIVASVHKLELFDKHGFFIKRIDLDDELISSCGIAVISNRPRRVAVANYTTNNVKIFNY
ncbi:tripartite motif-containing protein 2-like [Anneissia japonica]|uniref:tripartite motif-containing protein 2-like n=1 Tax=Anneissia japonica TaxID=1529436 RepID=UPI00142570C2|nr:tripartite motif-containing protein 2-like [Anneissia japonica]